MLQPNPCFRFTAVESYALLPWWDHPCLLGSFFPLTDILGAFPIFTYAFLLWWSLSVFVVILAWFVFSTPRYFLDLSIITSKTGFEPASDNSMRGNACVTPSGGIRWYLRPESLGSQVGSEFPSPYLGTPNLSLPDSPWNALIFTPGIPSIKPGAFQQGF